MIKASHHRVIHPLFQWLTRFLIRRHFQSVHWVGDLVLPDAPILLLANHRSWWDGFWMDYLNQERLHRQFYFMMLERQLVKHWYFRYVGGYSVRKGSVTVRETLRYTVDLLKKKNHAVLLFPQGKIQSGYRSRFQFEKGVDYLLRVMPEETAVLFAATFTDYLSDRKPHLYIYTQLLSSPYFKEHSIEESYNQFYQQALNQQQQQES